MKFIIFIFLPLISCSVNSDYSNKKIIKDNPYINSIDTTVNLNKLIATDTIVFYEVNASKLKALKEEAFFVYVWATWCGPCVEKLPELIEYSQENNDRILFVGIDYYYPGMYKLLKRNNFSGNAYILDAKDYSSNIWKKLVNFRNDICEHCDTTKNPSAPSIYLINNNDSTVFFLSESLSAFQMDSVYIDKINELEK